MTAKPNFFFAIILSSILFAPHLALALDSNQGSDQIWLDDNSLNEPHRKSEHRPEPMRSDPPAHHPGKLQATGYFLNEATNENYSYSFAGKSLFEVFRSCYKQLNSLNKVNTDKIFVTVKSDKTHIKQCLTPHSNSITQKWNGSFSICEQIGKEVASTHGLQSNCSRYAHKQHWFKTLKETITDTIPCTGKKQKGQIIKTYEKLQKYQCIFSVGVPTNFKKRGDLIQEKKSCSYRYDDCEINGKTFKHKTGRWQKTVGSIQRKSSCGAGFSGYKLIKYDIRQTFACNDGDGVSVGNPVEVASQDAIDSSKCIVNKKRCGPHAHGDEWMVRVGRRIVEKSCIGKRTIEVSYPKLRTMICDDGKQKWKNKKVILGKYPVTPTQSCKDSSLTNTVNH